MKFNDITKFKYNRKSRKHYSPIPCNGFSTVPSLSISEMKARAELQGSMYQQRQVFSSYPEDVLNNQDPEYLLNDFDLATEWDDKIKACKAFLSKQQKRKYEIKKYMDYVQKQNKSTPEVNKDDKDVKKNE